MKFHVDIFNTDKVLTFLGKNIIFTPYSSGHTYFYYFQLRPNCGVKDVQLDHLTCSRRKLVAIKSNYATQNNGVTFFLDHDLG